MMRNVGIECQGLRSSGGLWDYVNELWLLVDGARMIVPANI